MARFNYRGKAIEDLQKMNTEDFIKLMPSRQRRTIKRGQVKNHAKLFKRIDEAIKQLKEGKPQRMIKTHLRSLVITPNMMGLAIHVHKGNEFKKVVINEKMIGHYLGEYTLNRKMVKHSSPGVGASKSSKFTQVK